VLDCSRDQGLRGESGRMELINLSTMIEWWSGLDGPNGLTSAPMSYDLRFINVV